MTETASVQATHAERPSGRSFLLDLFKAAGCILIVLHHLAFYGPMADVAAQAWPGFIDWLAQHARLAVQMFLVCAGFLMAQTLQSLPQLSLAVLPRSCSKRYLRLAIPLLAALSFTVIASEMIRPAFQHDSLSALPSVRQALAHVFFLQHLLGMEALSAGVWYVAVDFQLYLSALLLAWLGQALQAKGWGRQLPWLGLFAGGLTLSSLLYWSHRDALEDVALFFWGAYGMGWMAWHARTRWTLPARVLLWLALGGLCFFFDERGRALTAWALSAALVGAPAGWLAPHHQAQAWRRPVQRLSEISYSVFVIHFGVSLVVNFALSKAWPASVAMNALGMACALSLSLLAGEILYRWTEQGPATWRKWMQWAAAFMASTGLAMWIAG
jgi:peptidoglycan/LPS O-acetylase OafA/YrhL